MAEGKSTAALIASLGSSAKEKPASAIAPAEEQEAESVGEAPADDFDVAADDFFDAMKSGDRASARSALKAAIELCLARTGYEE